MKKQTRAGVSAYETTLRLYPLLLFVGSLTAFYGYRLYFPFLDLSLDSFTSFVVLCTICLLAQSIIDSVPFFKASLPGLIMGTVLTFEAVLFVLFVQYYPLWSLLIAALTVAIAVGIYRRVKNVSLQRNENTYQFRSACRQHAAVLTAAVLCFVLAVPSAIGVHTEYFADDLSAEEWEVFVQILSEATAKEYEYESQRQPAVAQSYLDMLADWDDLSQEERERALRTVALNEMKELGIGADTQLQMVTAKLDEETLGSYNDQTKTVRINYEYLHDATLEEMLETVLHEMHHAYAHYVVQTLDFSSEEVQNGYYYKHTK